mgnify:CR=1 FL=1
MSNKADMTNHTRNIVIVLGMHRSGTSVFTGALKIVGFDLGRDIMQANEYNVKGYFENNKIVELKYALNDDNDANKVSGQFPFRLNKNSKYVNGVNTIKQFPQ